MHAWRKNEALCIFECILTMVMMLMTLDGHKFVYLYSVSYVVSHFPQMLYSYVYQLREASKCTPVPQGHYRGSHVRE
jgi:hypothetical protein